jgi:hypothetical protein
MPAPAGFTSMATTMAVGAGIAAGEDVAGATGIASMRRLGIRLAPLALPVMQDR